MKALDFITSQPWAIEQSALEQMLTILERREDLEALQTRIGEPLRNTRTVEDRGGVAVIPVTGPIFRYANLFTEISGGTSTQVLATDIQTALDDVSIRALVLEINSPGGRSDGVNELAQMIYDARGKKPIRAYVEGAGQSAGYWIGSAAEQLIVDKTALVGSIGVVATLLKDTGKRDERSGVKRIEIVSSSSPNKRVDPETDEGRAAYQTIVDEMADVFIEAVAKHRAVTPEVVRNDFGRGGSLVGLSAVRAGMADRAGSLESVIAELAGPRNTKFGGIHMSKAKTIAVATTAALHAAVNEGYTLEQITITEPDLDKVRAEAKAEGLAEGETKAGEQITAARAEGVAEGEKAERARIVGIQALAAPGFEKEIHEAIEAGTSVEATAVSLMKLAKDRGVTLSQLAADGSRIVPHGNPADPHASSRKLSRTSIFAGRAKAVAPS